MRQLVPPNATVRILHFVQFARGFDPALSDKKAKPEPYARAYLPGGRGGIRTHGTVSGTLVFKTSALNHSATLPGYFDDTIVTDFYSPL